MQQRRFDFRHLLEPFEPENFFTGHWETKPLHVRRADPRYYEEVLTLEALEQLIASPDARYPAIQLSKEGAYFPAGVYCDDRQLGGAIFTGVTDVQKIASEYRAGATVVLPGLHRTYGPLSALCTSIERELDHVVHANAYLTPGNTAGFTPHYDTHEVFVLQIAGRKHWRIYRPPIELPHRKQPFTPVGYTLPSRPLLDIELAPGDLLYLPRGYVHTTTTAALHSAHVTIGIAVYTWLDLAGELLQFGMSSSRARKALPAGFASRTDLLPAIETELAGVLNELRNTADGAQLIDMFLKRIRSNKTTDRGTFRSDVVVIDESTWLKVPPADEYRLARQGTKVTLDFKQRRFTLPAESHASLKSMQALNRFRAVDLSGSLDPEARIALIRLLHERGFLTRANDGV